MSINEELLEEVEYNLASLAESIFDMYECTYNESEVEVKKAYKRLYDDKIINDYLYLNLEECFKDYDNDEDLKRINGLIGILLNEFSAVKEEVFADDSEDYASKHFN